jgi:opacity protein-like surface antigen
MKKTFVLFMLLLSSILFAQDFENKPMFSKSYFGVMGGTNFNTLPTAGTAINFEIKSNITSSINGKLSIGYSTLYDDDSYEIKSSGLVSFENYSKYHTRLTIVERVRYAIIPFTLGVEYLFTKSNLSPFGLFEIGYNLSSSTIEGKVHDGIAGTFDTAEEVPEDYRQIKPALDNGSSITMGIGLGVKYKLTERMDLNIRYLYHYNEAIINNNQVLIGFTF